MKIDAVDHIGIVVRSMREATEEYCDVLGFTDGGLSELADRGLLVRELEVGATRIELLAPTRPDSEISVFLQKHGEGLHHICVSVSNLDAKLDDLKKKGATIVGDGGTEGERGVQIGADGSRIAFVHPRNCRGVLLELKEQTAVAALK